MSALQPVPKVDETQLEAARLNRPRTPTPECQHLAPITLSNDAVRRVYPPGALDAGVQGWAYVQYDIETNGSLANVAVVYSEPGDVFDACAARAIQNLDFAPRAERCASILSVVRFLQYY